MPHIISRADAARPSAESSAGISATVHSFYLPRYAHVPRSFLGASTACNNNQRAFRDRLRRRRSIWKAT